MFVANGYWQTPMSQIASAVGLTKAGLYHYFKSKEELLFVIHEEDLKKNLIPILEQAEKIVDPKERLAWFIKAFTKRAMAADPSMKVLIHEVGNLKPQHQKEIQSVWKRTLDLLRNALAELEKTGGSKKFNKSFAAFAALGMCSWTLYWFDYDRKESADELAETFKEIFLNGLIDK